MKRLTYKFVKEQFNNRGYALLSNVYINGRTKLNYICSEGHTHSVTWRDFKSGRGCCYCGLENRSSKRRLDFNIIKKSFDNDNYILLTLESDYKNVDQKLEFICNNGHRHFMSWHNWGVGWRCKYCHHDKLSILCSGENHYNWKGGISCEPYCHEWSFKEFKDTIKERDGNRCLNPDCWGNIHRLCVHHIDYNKKNCEPENLITLCASCNSRANFDRKRHTSRYKAIIRKKIIRRN